jgi:hypothetical protein
MYEMDQSVGLTRSSSEQEKLHKGRSTSDVLSLALSLGHLLRALHSTILLKPSKHHDRPDNLLDDLLQSGKFSSKLTTYTLKSLCCSA